MKQADFGQAEWIFGADNRAADTKMIFRRNFSLDAVPPTAVARIAAETKYWLWINGALAVFEGGVFRESKPGCGWADEVDIAPYLRTGRNQITALVWYYGNGGRNNSFCPEGGFIFACDAVGLYSDSRFLCMKHPAYVKSGAPHPAYLYGGDNAAFDARLDVGAFWSVDFDESGFMPAVGYENKVWGDMMVSMIPPVRIGEAVRLDLHKTETGYEASLPYAMTATFAFRAAGCHAGDVLDVRTDRYNINGGPTDEFHNYNGHRIEFTCREGDNDFEGLMYLYGEKVIITCPENVVFTDFSFRESGYDCDIIGSVKTNDPVFDRLIGKCIRTLYVCMRNNFMDCPDRERGQWIGDVSVQAPQVFYVLDDRAKLLLKKAISDYIGLRKGDVLVGNVPGDHFCEFPSQNLVAISEFGLLAEYYDCSGDAWMPSFVLEPCVKYLMLWGTDERGLLIPRQGTVRWFDHHWNADGDVLENCMYVSACKFARRMADVTGDHRFDGFLEGRISSISAGIETYYWKGDYYSSDNRVDERPNAIAVLCGLVPEERYPAIRTILLEVFNSTPYMERFVLAALCKMGYCKDAYLRMMSRYYNLAVNENSTVWEDFFILGTKNHAWSGCPVEIAFRYLFGITSDDGFRTFSVNPCPEIRELFTHAEVTFNAGGKKTTVKIV